MVVGEKSIAENGDREVGFESFKVGRCYVLVVVEDGELNWGFGDGWHGDNCVSNVLLNGTQSSYPVCNEHQRLN